MVCGRIASFVVEDSPMSSSKKLKKRNELNDNKEMAALQAYDYPNHADAALDLSRKASSESDLLSRQLKPDSYYQHHRRLSSSPVHHRESPPLVVSVASYGSPERSPGEVYNLHNNLQHQAGNPGVQYHHHHHQLHSNSNSPSSSAATGHGSPSYASCYPGGEHLSQYVLQAAAFQQQIILQRQQRKKVPKNDSDAVSEAGSEGSSGGAFPIYSSVPERNGKLTRPFKAYPKDPLSLTAGLSSVDGVLDTQSAEKYSAFRKRMLEQICAANGGQATVTNPKMRRTVNTTINNQQQLNHQNNNCTQNNNNYSSEEGGNPKGGKDTNYSERRRKNNAAAKKSRDRRRIKEDEIAIRAAFLERENIELKFELAAARKQLASCGIVPVTHHSSMPALSNGIGQ